MGTLNTGFARTLLMGCAISSVLSFQAMAAGDGVIVLERTVNPHPFGRPVMTPDPHPTTVNANPVNQVTNTVGNELGDGEIAGINSGSTINHMVTSHTNNLPGLSNSNGLPGMTAGHGGGSGSGISNQVNRSVQQGMGALNNIGRGQ